MIEYDPFRRKYMVSSINSFRSHLTDKLHPCLSNYVGSEKVSNPPPKCIYIYKRYPTVNINITFDQFNNNFFYNIWSNKPLFPCKSEILGQLTFLSSSSSTVTLLRPCWIINAKLATFQFLETWHQKIYLRCLTQISQKCFRRTNVIVLLNKNWSKSKEKKYLKETKREQDKQR